MSLPQQIRVVADLNVELASELSEVTAINNGLVSRLAESKKKLEWVNQEMDETRRRVAFIGSSEAIGKVLNKRRGELPSIEHYRRDLVNWVKEIERASSRVIELEESRKDIDDLEQKVQQLMEASSEEINEMLAGIEYYRPNLETDFRARARRLLQDQHEQLGKLAQHYSRYITQLSELDLAERQLVLEAEKFSAYIDEQLIWIASLPTLAVSDMMLSWKGVSWLVDPHNWTALFTALLESTESNPVRLLPAVLLVLLLVNRKRVQQMLQTQVHQIRGIREESILHTLQAILYTVLLSILLPSLLYLVYRMVIHYPLSEEIALQWVAPLPMVALNLALLQFLRIATSADGFARLQLQWPEQLCNQLQARLRWLNPLLLVLFYVVLLAEAGGSDVLHTGLGRPAWIASMLLLGVLFWQLMYSEREAATHQKTLFISLLAASVLLLIASVMGYHHTALLLGGHIYVTLIFLLAVLLLRDSIMRYLQISDRRLRYEEAVRRRDELRRQRQQEEEEYPGGSSTVEQLNREVVQEGIDVQELGEQARRLLMTATYLLVAVGFWLIWRQLIPALGALETVTLPLTTTELVDGIEQVRAVNLLDLTFGGVLILLTVILSKNLPGLMEIILLQRLPLDVGSRYAIRTLTQYLIVAVGLIAIFNALGVQWSSIQWLVAALSVGLGFGLQEIVANFVSGIILLFERPMRVGDTVTVGDVTGTVIRIRIRATTIRTWDRQELVVPNKEFITGQLLNWTLGDQVNRVTISIGVAYGSDVDRAHSLMLQAAQGLDTVLKDPEPVVSFEEFGDNALILRLRIYLDSIDNRLPVITALHREINRLFNEQGIVMAFPQRDIHFNPTQPLNIRLQRG